MQISFIPTYNKPYYIELHDYFIKQILDGKIKKSDHMPSIRELSKMLQVSRTTIENCYDLLLSEGYIISKPRSGYFCDLPDGYIKKRTVNKEIKQLSTEKNYPYTFSSRQVDYQAFDLKLWQRYTRAVMDDASLMSSYGQPFGEQNLKDALENYLYMQRGVQCESENIVIGAGIQPLLFLLCGLLKNKVCKIAFLKPVFLQASKVFEDCHHKIIAINHLDELNELEIDFLYLTPSTLNLNMKDRFSLLKLLTEKDIFLIEDDYNGEMHYLSPGYSSFQGLCNDDRVIYLQSFSKLLLPSIRLACMCLPNIFIESLNNRAIYYNQTASKLEQYVFCFYLQEGHLERRIKRLRRQSVKKSEILKHFIENELKVKDYIFNEYHQLYIVPYCLNDDFYSEAKKIGIAFEKESMEALYFSFLSIDENELPNILEQIKKLVVKD